jgi:hypothetical protein
MAGRNCFRTMSEISSRICLGFNSDAGLVRLGSGRLLVASAGMTAFPVEVTDAGAFLKGSESFQGFVPCSHQNLPVRSKH